MSFFIGKSQVTMVRDPRNILVNTKKENDIYAQPMLGISKDGYICRSRPIIRDSSRIQSYEQIKRKEVRILRYNNKIMGIKVITTKKQTVVKEKPTNKIVYFEGKEYTIIKH
jgi:hypothetical protein